MLRDEVGMTKAGEPRWRKSSFSGGGSEDCVEVALAVATWRKSSFSGGSGEDCVEVAPFPASRDESPYMIAVRDSKNPNGPRLRLTAAQWAHFTNEIKRGA
jgi:hypothetical protein